MFFEAIDDVFSNKDLEQWCVIPEFENKNTMLSQYGWPLTFILKPNGKILDFHLGGIKECSDLKSIEDIIKQSNNGK